MASSPVNAQAPLFRRVFAMMGLMRLNVKRFFQDKDGHVILWQAPNFLLSSWIVLKTIEILLDAGRLKTGFERFSTAVLFTWAYYELTKGVDMFRKTLGITVLVIIIAGFFMWSV
jgi:hypothetical protein